MKSLLPAIIALLPACAFAQSTIDAYTLSQNDTRGTARFMSMGGAFTALGGDLSSIGQNPAGVGVYRSNDIGATLDINFRSYNAATPYGSQTDKQTKAFCNNFGYAGSTYIGEGLTSLSWGINYGRVASFDRIINGYNCPTGTSLTNYIAAFSAGQPSTGNGGLAFQDGYNPYLQSQNDWLSILAYNSYMIDDKPGRPNEYVGLFQNGTVGDALYNVHERGYVDEYNFDIAGNVNNTLYWGFGFGITDINYIREVLYSESMENARIYDGATGAATGDAGFDLYNRKRITGNGWNFKIGLIYKPVQMLRFGFAFHTPTYYTLSHGYDAEVDYSYFNPAYAQNEGNPMKGNEYTEWATFDSKLRTPWRIMVGAALVIGNNAIVSVDYERQAYNSMKVQYQSGYASFTDDPDVNANIKDTFQGSNIVRLGLEYRLTPQVSLRAGYNARSCNVREAALNNAVEILTSGTDPSFSLDRNVTQQIGLGIGYKYQGWYFDAAYIYRRQDAKFQAYTAFDGYAPTADLTNKYNSLVLSIGYKF